MTQYCGREFLLKIEDPDTPGSYIDIGGFVTNSLDETDPPVDGTTKLDGGHVVYVAGCGTRTTVISGDGIVSDDDGFAELLAQFRARTQPNVQLVSTLETITGAAHIENLNRTGAEGDKLTFTTTLHISGAPTVT